MKKPSQEHIIMCHLLDINGWCATHDLMQQPTRYGWIGSAGHVRARELARDGKIERKRGAEIGLDPRYTYFRAKPLTQCTLRV